jgi:hypothetical protein
MRLSSQEAFPKPHRLPRRWPAGRFFGRYERGQRQSGAPTFFLAKPGLSYCRVQRTRFIEPPAPVLRFEPPVGLEWRHEVKHNGWRAQLHLRIAPSLSAIGAKRTGWQLSVDVRS